jgi:uncharacterized protein
VRVTEGPEGASFAVRVVPRAGRTAVAGIRGDALLVRLAAPPVDGAANEALLAFLATLLDHPKRDVVIASGHTSRDKRLVVRGISAADVSARVAAILPPHSSDRP